jgi:hypothetical protein
MKFHRLQNEVLCTTGDFPWRTPVGHFHASQYYASSKQKSYKIMQMQMSETQDKEKLDTGSLRGLNLAAMSLTID